MRAQCLSALWAAAAATAEASFSPLPLEMEVYHINPYHLGAIPVNMDTGDARGDLFFDMAVELLAPLTCADNRSSAPQYGITCDNEEVNAHDLVTNKLRLRATGEWSTYALCNIGTENNTDPLGLPCASGTYCCVCVNQGTFNRSNFTRPCEAKVGRETVNSTITAWPSHSCDNTSNGTNGTGADWQCWNSKVGDKLLVGTDKGYWYSTLETGYCPHHPDPYFRDNCTWEVTSVEKVVNRTCHLNSFFSFVEAYNRSCFEACGTVRNFTAPCWVRCFYTTALGPESGHPGGKVTGIPVDVLQQAWTAAFDSEDEAKGGCPGLPVLGDTRRVLAPPARAARDTSIVVQGTTCEGLRLDVMGSSLSAEL